MDEWIKSAINEKAYKRAYDSALTIIASDSLTIEAFVRLDKKSQSYEKELVKTIKKEKANGWIWKGSAIGISVAWIVREVKQMIK